MASQKDVKNRIASIKNINKITRAMEMVAAARLRRAEQRIAALRPYAEGMRKLTRRAAEQAGGMPRVPVLVERESVKRVGVVLVTGDRGLAGAFNTNIIRDGHAARQRAARAKGVEPVFSVVGRKGVSALTFRKQEVTQLLHRLHRPPRLRQRARDRRGADRALRRRGARPGRAGLQPLRLAADPARLAPDPAAAAAGRGDRRGRRGGGRRRRGDRDREGPQPLAAGNTSPRPRSCSPS